jgi:hyaluronoglucosaminidase
MSTAVVMGTGKTGSAAFRTRGIIEGFYGPPWTHAQRLDMIEFIAARGMNTFVYGPKDDPLVRRDWRVRYAGHDLARLAELAEHCARHGVELVYCLSPGLSIEYSSPRDRALLDAKFGSVAELGIRSFGLLLDDIPGELQHSVDREMFRDLADAHQHLIGAVFDDVLARDPRGRLVVCPTVYRGYGDEEYVTRLGRGIDPRIDVFWTGRAICSATLDLADAATISRSLARPVTYWDNYPVNDVAMGGELHVGPYLGRDRHLYRFATGVIANGMSLFESSKIAFATIADYLWAPETYDPEASLRTAIRDVLANEEDAAAFAIFADNVRSSCLCDEDAPEVGAALERFGFLIDTGRVDEAGSELSTVASRLRQAAEHLLGGSVNNTAIIAEARPWIEMFEVGARAIATLAERVRETPIDGGTAELLASHLRSLRATGRRVFGDALDMALSELIDGAATRRA